MSTSCAAAASLRHPLGEAHSPRAASSLVAAQRLWEGSLTPMTDCPPEGRGAPRANQHVRPANHRIACRHLAAFAATRQLKITQRVATSVAKNAFRDRMPHATQFTPATRRRADVDKTDCAQGGQQNRVGPLGHLGRHGPLAKTSPFFTRPAAQRQESSANPVSATNSSPVHSMRRLLRRRNQQRELRHLLGTAIVSAS
jgi:hypothetical protein